jgi:CBS domain-containing protein
MKTAADVMEQSTPRVHPELDVASLARLFVDRGLDGACVVDRDSGSLLGVVTAMDLVYQEKQVHIPTFFIFFEGALPLDRPSALESELAKISGATVKEIMSKPAISVGPRTGIDELASLMVEKHLTILPVFEDGHLLGVVTKRGILRALYCPRPNSASKESWQSQ